MKRYLILEDGSVYEGTAFGAFRENEGEVVFTTGMTGYQEAITDQSYANQILVFTNPLIGNYGVCLDDFESMRPHCRGVVCHEIARHPSNWRMTETLPQFLTDQDIPGLTGIDTRRLVRTLRTHGTLRGMLSNTIGDKPAILRHLRTIAPTRGVIPEVSTPTPYPNPGNGRTIVLIDFGAKNSILRELSRRDCNVIVEPYDVSLRRLESINPDGILLSNGPGNPEEMTDAIHTVAQLEKHWPLFGICMGHQVFALANDASTYKMRFGHRGFNHPVRDRTTGRIGFTSQNHGYAVDRDSLKGTDLEITHEEINDGTVEGLRHTRYPAFSVQFHPDAAPGPHDEAGIFDEFLTEIDRARRFGMSLEDWPDWAKDLKAPDPGIDTGIHTDAAGDGNTEDEKED